MGDFVVVFEVVREVSYCEAVQWICACLELFLVSGIFQNGYKLWIFFLY